MDIALLQVLADKDAYVRFKPFIKDYTLSKEGKQVYAALEIYHKTKAVAKVDWTEFESWFYIYRSGSITKENIEAYKKFFSQLRTYKSAETEKDVVSFYVKQAYAHQIGERTIAILREGKGEIDDISDLVDKYDKEVGRAIALDDLFVDDDGSSVLDRALKPGLNWRLPELNRSCGPLRGGDFVLVSAYVGVGKTTFTADQATYMAGQLPAGKKLVWVNNEERSDAVALRLRQAAIGKTLEAINKDRATAEAEYLTAMGGPARIHVLKNDSEVCNVSQLDALFSQVKPGLIVFDVLDKVEGLREKDEKEDRRLGRIYKWARRLAHEYDCPVIAVTQTNATGNDTRYVGMDQLRGSRVDKPAEADLIITIGKNKEVTADPNTRYIHIPKNKLTGGPMFEEKHRLGNWEVKINGPISRYES
jgi:replicative DNA helicase